MSKPEGARHKADALRAVSPEYREAIQIACKKLLAESICDDRIGDCLLCTRTPSQDTPQIQVTVDTDTTLTMQCSHVILIGNNIVPEYWYMQASHRCGNRYCINLEHLLWELPWDNISRDGCHKYGHFINCPHHPHCLKEPDFNLVKEIILQYLAKKTIADPHLLAFKEEVKRLQAENLKKNLDPGYSSRSSEYMALYWIMVKKHKK
jgi:hypothetical protein